MKKATISTIPQEIEEDILLRLPVKSILRFKCVCKSWYTLICSPKFVKDRFHLTNKNPRLIMMRNTNPWLNKGMFYSIDRASIISASSSSSSSSTCKCEGEVLMDHPMKGEVLSAHRFHTKMLACNGLLCLNLDRNRTLILWNPYTKESKKTILPSCLVGWPFNKGYGFGYDSRINDYKFVHIDWNGVNVYTLVSDIWRRVNTTTTCDFSDEGLHINGVLHWLGNTATLPYLTKLIVAFDLSNETYMSFPFPKETILRDSDAADGGFLKLKVLGDTLCFVYGLRGRVDVWVMQNYGVTESWTKQFTTKQVELTIHPYYLEFHWCFDNGEILIQVRKQFFLYDQENDRVRLLKINGTDDDFNSTNDNFSSVESKSYVENLVSLTCNRNLFI